METKKRIFISLIMRIKGNVNADENIGNRITIKKMISSDGSIRPFVSARAIRRAIRDRLQEKGFEIDPQFVEGEGNKAKLYDMGDPITYVDDDIFGYLAIKKKKGGEAGEGIPRLSAVKVSYLLSLKHAEIIVERGGRFPRPNAKEKVNPTPFEIEVADFIGLLNILVENRIGVFKKSELKDEVLNKHKESLMSKGGRIFYLDKTERLKRAKALLEILIKEGWEFPRASTSFNSAEFKYTVIATSNSFLPLGAFIDLDDTNNLDIRKIENFLNMYDDLLDTFYLIDYNSGIILHYNKDTKTLEESETNLTNLINELSMYIVD